MSTTCLTQQLQGKPIISVTNGEVIAKVLDVLVDPKTLRVAAAVTSKGSMFGRHREIDVIPGDEVQVWGQDAILVKRPDAIVKDSGLPGRETWLSVAEQVKGHSVIGTDGRRVGQLNDVVIDVDGQLVGYDLVQPFVPGKDKSQAMKQIPAESTSVLGQDVLIVELAQLEQLVAVEEPSQVDEVSEIDESLRAEDLFVDEATPLADEDMEEIQPESRDTGGLF